MEKELERRIEELEKILGEKESYSKQLEIEQAKTRDDVVAILGGIQELKRLKDVLSVPVTPE